MTSSKSTQFLALDAYNRQHQHRGRPCTCGRRCSIWMMGIKCWEPIKGHRSVLRSCTSAHVNALIIHHNIIRFITRYLLLVTSVPCEVSWTRVLSRIPSSCRGHSCCCHTLLKTHVLLRASSYLLLPSRLATFKLNVTSLSYSFRKLLSQKWNFWDNHLFLNVITYPA